MPARPVAIINQVPGSGTTPGFTPQGFFLFFPLPVPSFPPLPFFFSGPQTLVGNGGVEMGIQFPPPNGLYKLSGGAGPRPGAPVRSSNADSNGTGGPCRAVPRAGTTGSSNFCGGGSAADAACCGTSSTRLAQRPRAVIRPSVINFSPLCSLTLRRVQ